MNIREAKDEIKNAMKAYFTKDEFGEYAVPLARQRPVFLMGPPGIGKTAVMEQIASELGVALVSYSMTHHTRQSALGLPFIETKTYGGQEYSVSEYTMSEIIASVYDMMEATGLREGILFLDEINCVSETLAPSMLQFLQYKTFGRHRVPDGWIVVTAGNPPEYNKSVREFDLVTWDRLKRIDVEPDFACWKDYAMASGVHPAILSYLEAKGSNFYRIEKTVDGQHFVTARGWCDLSDMLRLYEKQDIRVTEGFVFQYLQHPQVAKEFAVYYDLFIKYRSDYQISDILAGKAGTELVERAKNARFDERLAVLSLLLDAIGLRTGSIEREELALSELMKTLKDCRLKLAAGKEPAQVLEDQTADRRNRLEASRKAGNLSDRDRSVSHTLIAALEEETRLLLREKPAGAAAAFALLKRDFDERTAALKKQAQAVGEELSNLFRFCEDAFADGQELLILVTELTMNPASARFISRYGCKEYFAHNKELLFYERQREIIAELEELTLEEG